MITYQVKVKKWFGYRTIKNVKGDGLVENGKARWFILNDETRIEIPSNREFIFSKERFLIIENQIRKEAGK